MRGSEEQRRREEEGERESGDRGRDEKGKENGKKRERIREKVRKDRDAEKRKGKKTEEQVKGEMITTTYSTYNIILVYVSTCYIVPLLIGSRLPRELLCRYEPWL